MDNEIKHSDDHIAACRAARIDDAVLIKNRYGYDEIDDAFARLPSVGEYADMTKPGDDPRLEIVQSEKA